MVAALVVVAICTLPSDLPGQSASRPFHAWLTAGMGPSTFTPWPSLLFSGWLAYKGFALGVRRIDSSPSENADELVDRSVLFGGRVAFGPLLLTGAGGLSHTTGELSNGEQSGTTTPIEPENAPAVHAEASFALTPFLGFGTAFFWTGGTRSRNTGWAVIAQLGALR